MIKVAIFKDGVVLSKDEFDTEDLGKHEEGIALTYAELEHKEREAFAAGNQLSDMIGSMDELYQYWQSQNKKGNQ